jgi:ubiquinone/menaquinone biosynthesis C-methylase UbiE
MDQLPRGRILELGFGTGRVLRTLSAEKREIYGIDLSHQMTRITSRRLRANNLQTNICQAIAQDLPFPNESFQSLIATFPSEYIFHQDTFKEAWRVLKTDGVFIIIPGVSQILGWKKRKSLIGLLDEAASILCRLTGEAIGADEEWKKIFQKGLQEFGFKVDIELIQQKRAVILRIIARKQPALG